MPSGKSSKQDTADNVLTGVYIFPNEEKYEGEYADHGEGRIERSGKGSYYFTDGRVYTGNWVKDKMCGQGEMKYVSGASYKGEFHNNEYNGSGTYSWPDGSAFTGTFVKNRMTGKGEFTDADSHVWIGTFTEREALGLRIKLS